MTKGGWTVVVRRRPRPRDGSVEMWDCAISHSVGAEKAVRDTCDPDGVTVITAITRLTVEDVTALGLQHGQVRKRRPAAVGMD